jgi:hypothetical protein
LLTRFVCVRHLTQRGQLIDDARQVSGERGDQLLAWEAGLARQGVDLCGAEGLLKLVRRDRLVAADVDPGLRDYAVPAMGEAIEELADSFAVLLAAA